MRIIEAFKRDDNGLTKGLIILGVAGLGVATIVGLRRWQQRRQGGSGCTDVKPKAESGPKPDTHTTPVKPITKPADKPPVTTTPTAPPPVKPIATPPTVTPPVVKPPVTTPTAPVSTPASDNTLRDAAKPSPSTPLKDAGASPKPSAPSAAPAAEAPKSVTPAPAPSPSKPAAGGFNNGKDDLSMSSTFEKVSADGGSLPPSKGNEDILHDVSRKPLHSSPPSADAAHSGGGPKSLGDSLFDSSIETPVFGGHAYSMLSDVELDASTFNPAVDHPAMFGFKFDGPSS